MRASYIYNASSRTGVQRHVTWPTRNRRNIVHINCIPLIISTVDTRIPTLHFEIIIESLFRQLNAVYYWEIAILGNGNCMKDMITRSLNRSVCNYRITRTGLFP